MESISALIPVRDGAVYLKYFLPILKSNMQVSDEVIFVDDHSSDNTVDIIKTFVKKYELKNYTVTKNTGRGLVSALNLGVSISQNNWIARFDIDDKYEINRIQRQRKLINEANVAIFSDYDIFLNGEQYLGTIPTAVDPSLTAISLVNSQRTPHPSVVFSKAAVLDAGGYKEEDFPAEDLSLWLRLAKLGDLVTVPETLLHYNLNPKSTSFKMRNESLFHKNKVIRKYGINVNAISNYFKNSKIMVRNYERYQLSEIRELLGYYDVLALREYGYLDNRKIFTEILRLGEKMMHPNNLIQFVRFYNEKKLRNKIRHSNAE